MSEEIEKLKKEKIIVVPYGLYVAGDLIQTGIEIGIKDEKNKLSVFRYDESIDKLVEKIRTAEKKMKELPDTLLPDNIGSAGGFVTYRGEEYR